MMASPSGIRPSYHGIVVEQGCAGLPHYVRRYVRAVAARHDVCPGLLRYWR